MPNGIYTPGQSNPSASSRREKLLALRPFIRKQERIAHQASLERLRSKRSQRPGYPGSQPRGRVLPDPWSGRVRPPRLPGTQPSPPRYSIPTPISPSREGPTGKRFTKGQKVGGGRVIGFNPNGSPIISMGGGRRPPGARPPILPGQPPKTVRKPKAPPKAVTIARPSRSKRKKAGSGPPKRKGMRNRLY